ncbi:hypothetical protein M409DRAFT_57937 [Zasmidium cellare ATCC 36951]|uniref:Uncharacterized protein n=1 Tax=Zasmidium cellare ATCC 36951 TaxID=1080233 RepID=A0A6A6C763_ZASCE|nr:uncharacterized protein M409DRAFT_57937 [Zasmidium cellare ATCC 36951]KAF2162885.1 hypothetical protein M409DRAFT_57937 [Zasmidium cellare ATCC 36951]
MDIVDLGAVVVGGDEVQGLTCDWIHCYSTTQFSTGISLEAKTIFSCTIFDNRIVRKIICGNEWRMEEVGDAYWLASIWIHTLYSVNDLEGHRRYLIVTFLVYHPDGSGGRRWLWEMGGNGEAQGLAGSWIHATPRPLFDWKTLRRRKIMVTLLIQGIRHSKAQMLCFGGKLLEKGVKLGRLPHGFTLAMYISFVQRTLEGKNR